MIFIYVYDLYASLPNKGSGAAYSKSNRNLKGQLESNNNKIKIKQRLTKQHLGLVLVFKCLYKQKGLRAKDVQAWALEGLQRKADPELRNNC